MKTLHAASTLGPIAHHDESNRPRVLILRSCRAAQFADAVRFARGRHPKAEIVALSHRGHRDSLIAAGVDRVIEIPGRRFGLLRIGPWTLRRLRSEAFDHVVIPQMTAFPEVHVNLYWLAVALRPQRVTVLPGEQAPWDFDRRTFLPFVRRETIGALSVFLDTPLFLAFLFASCFARRQRHLAAADGRRRVLHIISSLGVGGAQVQLAELINRTPADRYHVELLVLGGDGEFSRQWLKRDDVEVTFVHHWPRMTRSVLEIRDRCREGHYDLVHTWLFMANIVGVAGARLAGVPSVISSVRNLSLWKRQWYRKWWFRIADTLASYASDVVTVNARALVRDHAQWACMPESRIEVVHNGLDPSRLLADRRDSRRRVLELTGAPDNAIIIGTVGRLAHEKDHVTFLRLLAKVRKNGRNVHGLVIGDGELRSHLEAVARNLGLSAQVTFAGERSDARKLMAGLDVFVLASRIEGFPNVLLEATFLGVPCVATDVGGNPDVLEFPESLFPPGEIWAGAARVLALLDAPSEAAERAERTRQRAITMFTADRTAAAWFGLYDRCLTEETV